MSPAPTPVPLDEIEEWYPALDDVCQALRIAVEGLAAVRERSDDPVACATALEGEWAVRELVDLGEKP